jgi:pimeloyl-ACP methyl ester carboxylesterase
MSKVSEEWRCIPRNVDLALDDVVLKGELRIPRGAQAIVLFIHGSGSSRNSPRNKLVASVLNKASLATLLFDLLTSEEESLDFETGQLRFDIGLLARRVLSATKWLSEHAETLDMKIGYFGASTGAAAALVAANQLQNLIDAVVCRGGRPDLAEAALKQVSAPTLLIVGAQDKLILQLNSQALELLPGKKQLAVVPGASHLFEEPGTIEIVANLASEWFNKYLLKPQ